jgi:CTD small phosphatase-like protein 2
MDETLIHYDAKAKKLNIRPHAKEFIQIMAKYYEVVIFTASEQIYADPILDNLEEKSGAFTHRLYRDSCDYCRGFYMKNLNRLNRNLAKTIIVDNNELNF